MTTWADRLAVLKGHADAVFSVPGARAGWGLRPQFMEQPAANLAVKMKIRGLRKLGFEETNVVETAEDSDEYVSRQKTHKRLRVEYKFEAQSETDSFLVWDFANKFWNMLATDGYREDLKAVEMSVVRREPMVDYEVRSMGRMLSVVMFEALYSFRDVLETPIEIVEDLVLTVTLDETAQPSISLPGIPA